MRVNTNELRVLVDVDKTLIVKCSIGDYGCFYPDYYGVSVAHAPLYGNIQLLKAQKARGYEVIVHSANGYKWAETIIKALKLEEFVDEVATKPLKYIDDKPADEWMQRVFIPENE